MEAWWPVLVWVKYLAMFGMFAALITRRSVLAMALLVTFALIKFVEEAPSVQQITLQEWNVLSWAFILGGACTALLMAMTESRRRLRLEVDHVR